MLIRIVRMTFLPEEVDAFIELFESTKDRIRHFPGCHHLTLLKDYNEDNIFSTYSVWENEEALNTYRHSELFAGVWKATKAKFSDKPLAFSNKEFIKVE